MLSMWARFGGIPLVQFLGQGDVLPAGKLAEIVAESRLQQGQLTRAIPQVEAVAVRFRPDAKLDHKSIVSTAACWRKTPSGVNSIAFLIRVAPFDLPSGAPGFDE